MERLICFLIGYVFGNFPTGYLLGKFYGVDITKKGSGNVGTTNVLRNLGAKAGVITMLDQGRLDEKIIAIPFEDPTYNTYRDISELPAHTFTEISHFFTVYKSLEGKETVVDELRGAQEAQEVIQKCLDAYVDKFCR